jgi:prepilin-type N-terminal cleavage/methylation domain-containing protein
MKLIERPTPCAGFTLIELLVVISIIAILAGLAGPGLSMAAKNGRLAQATGNARQIGLALRMYAQDQDGAYPGELDSEGRAITTANDAFRELIPAYLDSEVVFAVGTSPVGKRADNNITAPARILERGENHWAYISGLNSTSSSSWPMIVDHTDGAGRYTDKETEPGGTWKGTHGVVVRTDNSAASLKLMGTGQKRYLPRHDDKKKNALDVQEYMGKGAKLLEPVR